MTRYRRRIRFLAACLSALAGYIDALGFLSLGGFFVSFMSGNSTLLGAGLARGSSSALVAVGLIAAFVLGVIAGSLTGRLARSSQRLAVLTLVSVLLALAAASASAGAAPLAAGLMALAMGAENAVFTREGEVSIGLTYMTGTLVKLGQQITAAFFGGDPLAWAPYLLLWLGLVAGAVTGAATYARVGLNGLWPAAVVAAGLAVAAARIGPDEKERAPAGSAVQAA